MITDYYDTHMPCPLNKNRGYCFNSPYIPQRWTSNKVKWVIYYFVIHILITAADYIYGILSIAAGKSMILYRTSCIENNCRGESKII